MSPTEHFRSNGQPGFFSGKQNPAGFRVFSFRAFRASNRLVQVDKNRPASYPVENPIWAEYDPLLRKPDEIYRRRQIYRPVRTKKRGLPGYGDAYPGRKFMGLSKGKGFQTPASRRLQRSHPDFISYFHATETGRTFLRHGSDGLGKSLQTGREKKLEKNT